MGAILISVTRSKWNSSEIFGFKFHLIYVLYMYNNKKIISSSPCGKPLSDPFIFFTKGMIFLPKQKLLKVF